MSEKKFDWRTPVIAIDFDGCLCEDDYPEIGKPNEDVIEQAKRLQRDGACLILWTCRGGKELDAAVEACRNWGLEFDAVNKNPQFRIDFYGTDCRKVGADEYWDDKAVWMAAPGPLRNIRGATVERRSREWLLGFAEKTIRQQIKMLRSESSGDDLLSGTAMILEECREDIIWLLALLDERNEAHAWYKDGYKDATENAAQWVAQMIGYMENGEAGEKECE